MSTYNTIRYGGNAYSKAGSLILISTQTASNSASISFTTGLDSTYKEYQFYFIDIHPRTDEVKFQFNMSTDSGSNYNVTKTSSAFRAFHFEDDSNTTLEYRADNHLAQSTAYQNIIGERIGSGADESIAGYMSLFNPSSTTYVKHYISVGNEYNAGNVSVVNFISGYGNTTSAINAVQFKMSSGNFDGNITMYGVK